MTAPDPSDRVDLDASLCGSCHRSAEFGAQEKTYHPYYDEWQNSSHALSLTAAGGQVATDPDCQGCHVAQVIIEETFEGGSVTRPVQDPQPIVCAVCHDPHGSTNENQLRKPKNELCNTCHTVGTTLPGEVIRHPQSSMRTGVSGVDPSDVPKLEFMRDVECSDCHMYSTGPPQNITGHSFEPKAEACVACHAVDPRTFPLTLDQASSAIDAWQSPTIDMLLSVSNNIGKAEVSIENAHLYHFSNSVLASAQEKFDDANYSMNFVKSDRSYGAHNPPYALALLTFANESALEIIEMLTPGTVVGTVLDENGDPLRGAALRISNTDVAVTDSNGSFTFDFASGTYALQVIRDGSNVATVENVQVSGGETTDLQQISTSAVDQGVDLLIIAIIIIIILAVVFVIVYFLKFRPEDKEE
jgi:predicted CXXCH cytochrome family protein